MRLEGVPVKTARSGAWYLGLSTYWFATSFKWFIMFFLLSSQVNKVVPDGERNSWWGLVVAIGAGWAFVGPSIFGRWSDSLGSRWGRRRPFIAVGAALTAVALFVLGGANTMPLLIVGYLMLQVSDDIGTGPYSALIPDLVSEEERGRASGMMGMLQLAAQIVAGVVGLVLGGNAVLIFGVIAVVNIVCALIVLAVVREAPSVAKKPERGLFAGWLQPWQSADFRWVWFTRFLTAFGFYMILLYVLNYLKDVVKEFSVFGLVTLGEPFQASVVIALMISLSGAVASVPAGRLADRIGRKRVIVVAGFIMFATLVPFCLIPNFSVILALAALFGAGYGAYLTADWALVADVLPSAEDTGKDMGVWQSSVATPQIFSGAAGLLVDTLNRGQMGLGYTVVFLLASLAFLAGTVLIRRVRGST